MIKVNGRYNDAIIFSDEPMENAIEQIKTLLDQKFFTGNKVRVMPDYHVGAGCTIGLTSTLESHKIASSLVGVDIGCGMLATKFSGSLNLEKLDSVIRENVPSGSMSDDSIRSSIHHLAVGMGELIETTTTYKKSKNFKMQYILKSLGTLGSGNHFIEVNVDSNGDTWLVIHSGSRNLGVQVADFFKKIAVEKLMEKPKRTMQRAIAEMKEEGRHSEIEDWVNEFKSRHFNIKDKKLAYVEGLDFEAYIRDMIVAQEYAKLNRDIMAYEIIVGMDWSVKEQIETVHNYIDTEKMIMRKGAVSAKMGEKLIIPVNMRDGSIIAVGKGNDDWNQSAPHGAGRVLGREQAKRELSMDKFEYEMKGIYSTSISEETLDESPMAYKDMGYLLRNIQDTVEIKDIIKPLYNFKAS